ncbi:MAG: DUF4493 domain-containing protein [Bacteroidales bacterium]|nr:DUF4493 domain-containing protein [Bacteroidales bacterium]
MKKILFFCAATLAMFSFSSCSDAIDYDVDGAEGEGRVFLRPMLNSEVKVESRAILSDDELAENAIIWISATSAKKNGVVRKYKGVQNVPQDGISLVSGSYVAEVWAGDSVPASFDNRYYKGLQAFDVKAGGTTGVTVECTIANSVVAVEYEDEIDEVLTDYVMTVGHKAGSLEYKGRDDEKVPGYFMMPSFDKNLTCTLTGKTLSGGAFTHSITIENAKPMTKYVVRVKHGGPTDDEIGGAVIKIEVDENAVEVEDRYVIESAPTFQGTNFVMSKPVMGQAGQITEKKVYIKSVSGFKDVMVSCDAFSEFLGIGGDDFEVLNMADFIRDVLTEKGFSYQHFTHAEEDVPEADRSFEEMKLIFDDNFMNLFPNGEHTVTFRVTDNNGKTASATMVLMLSDAKVQTAEMDAADAWTDHATLRGTVLKSGLTGIAFQYRASGTQQWNSVAASDDNTPEGTAVSTEISGLTPNTTYEYQMICNEADDVADILTFTTEDTTPLPNASFEDWCIDGKVELLCADKGSMFWDSGNHGSATMNQNITTPSEEVVHTGRYSAKLESQFVGLGIIGKFAAGNLFAGHYIRTDGTDGVLGWGRPFASRPKALRVWISYTPQTVNSKEVVSGSPLKEGDLDQGIVYIALVDNSISKTESGESWPVIVKTATKELFSKDDSNVIAYGERVFTEATSGMIEVNIPLEYFKTDVKASGIVVTCSASRYGDYFSGGRGSVMYVDDMELVY